MCRLTICLAVLIGVVLSIPFAAQAQTTPSCADPVRLKAVENPKVSIVVDPKTSWQPRGGTVGFTVSGNNVSLEGVKVIVCFGWPADNWSETKYSFEGRASLVKFDNNSATYNVVVPDLDSAHVSSSYRTGLWIVPLAAMRVIAYGGVADPTVDVQPFVGITCPLLALALAVVAIVIAFVILYFFGRNCGVPGKGFMLWMISTRNGVASLSQAQIMLWTFLIGVSAIYVMALTGVLIDISDSTLVLLGITGVATVVSKLQNSQQDARGAAQAEGKAAAPGKVLYLLKVGEATDSEVRLAWAPPVTGGPAAGFIVEYQETPAPHSPENPVWSAVGETIILPHHTVLGLAPATSYQFRVRAVNTAGQSGDPETTGPIQTGARQAPPADAPGPIGGLSIEGLPTMTGVKLAWSPSSGAPISYKVQRRRHDTVESWSDAPQQPIHPECALDGLISGVAYDFRVAAVNGAGQGPWSAVVTARTPRNPRWSDLVVVGDGRSEIDVTRAQMLFFTLVAAVFVGMRVLVSYVIPDIPQGILLLMGISNGVYLAAKFIPD